MGPLEGELYDSAIVIDLLNGVPQAADAMRTVNGAAISIVTWIEVMAGTRPDEDEATARTFLDAFAVLALSDEVAEETVRVRRERRLKLPDATILATARVHGRVLVTRNTRDFPADDPTIRVPYRL